MNLLLGFRMAFAGGRESAARMALMAVGVCMGVMLILLALSGLPILQNHIDRLAWHRTDAQTAATAPDPAMWLAVTDRYKGRDVIRVHVAALGPQPPVPPGVERLPGPGEKLVSPALAELLRTTPADQLGDRYPGRIVGSIGSAGLVMPDELVAIVGHTPDEMRAMHGAVEIRGIEAPGEPVDLGVFWGILFGLIAALVVGPVAVFVSMVTRIGGARREVRFAAFRLAGATRFQTAFLAVTETAIAAVGGTALGWLAYLAVRPIVAGQVTLGHGLPIFASDVVVPTRSLIVVLIAVPLLAAATTLVTLRPVQSSPLTVRRRGRRKPPGIWRLLPIAVGLLGSWYAATASRDPDVVNDEAANNMLGIITMLSVLSTLVGFFLAGAWVCMWLSRGLARLSRRATTLIVARRIAADPFATFRVIGGAALAIYVATGLGFTAAANEEQTADHTESATHQLLDQGVVAVHVQGAPEASLAPLMSTGVVVARVGPDFQIVVACAELARVTALECPLPEYDENAAQEDQELLDAQDLFELPYPNPTGADFIFGPLSFAEPDKDAELLPVQTLFIPTDGTAAAQERVRTLAARTIPLSRSKVAEDLAGASAIGVTGLGTVLPYVTVFVLLVAACSLTVAVITGVLERRRPFALLRASGMRLGELRTIVLLETGIPLAVTVVIGVGLAVVQAVATIPSGELLLPSGAYFAGLGVGALAAFAVSLIALPFMDIATRVETVRYE